jgi:hypothetical protein
MKKDVFIAYSRKNTSIAEAIESHLQNIYATIIYLESTYTSQL